MSKFDTIGPRSKKRIPKQSKRTEPKPLITNSSLLALVIFLSIFGLIYQFVPQLKMPVATKSSVSTVASEQSSEKLLVTIYTNQIDTIVTDGRKSLETAGFEVVVAKNETITESYLVCSIDQLAQAGKIMELLGVDFNVKQSTALSESGIVLYWKR